MTNKNVSFTYNPDTDLVYNIANLETPGNFTFKLDLNKIAAEKGKELNQFNKIAFIFDNINVKGNIDIDISTNDTSLVQAVKNFDPTKDFMIDIGDIKVGGDLNMISDINLNEIARQRAIKNGLNPDNASAKDIRNIIFAFHDAEYNGQLNMDTKIRSGKYAPQIETFGVSNPDNYTLLIILILFLLLIIFLFFK